PCTIQMVMLFIPWIMQKSWCPIIYLNVPPHIHWPLSAITLSERIKSLRIWTKQTHRQIPVYRFGKSPKQGGVFSALTALKILAIRQDACGFLPCKAKNPLTNPHTSRF
ncbi:MAG: hypothetical protein OSJ58_21985, partial [Dysosmobacter sp.]|nr:hypothetical protein [Dysosmobacter sp.]